MNAAPVLLIEPDRSLARTYRTALEAAGYMVEWAGTAQTAIGRADEQRPSLVILELQLAQHNGVEFLYEFRSYGEWQDIPVIIHSFTPPANLATLRQTLENDLGIVATLYKPRTSLDILVAAVRRHVPAESTA